MADELGALGNNRVSGGSKPSQPVGNPMSHKANAGFKGAVVPVTAETASSKSFDRLGSEYRFGWGRPRASPSRALGVGQLSASFSGGHWSWYSPRAMALTITWSDVIFLRPPPIRAFMAMWARGVLLSSLATGVGHKEQALAEVRGTDRRR